MAIDLNEEVKIFGFPRMDFLVLVFGEMSLIFLGVVTAFALGLLAGVVFWAGASVIFTGFMFYRNTLPKGYLTHWFKAKTGPGRYMPSHHDNGKRLDKELENTDEDAE